MRYKTLGRTGLTVSRLGLGTAEIGFGYGYSDKPLCSEQEAIELLCLAVDQGITFFDTASYYGLAEERIGLSGIAKQPNIVIQTKCAQFLEKGEFPEPVELEARIRSEVEQSIHRLRVEALTILMLHGPSKEQIEEGSLIEILSKLKQEGKICYTGVSTRGEEPVIAAIETGFFDVAQVAYSILDQRMAARVFPAAQKAGVGIVNRSMLLKGALTPLRAKLPKELDVLKKQADKVELLATSEGGTTSDLAMRFVGSSPFIATSLIGTNKPHHLLSAIESFGRAPLAASLMDELGTLAISDAALVDPAKWPKIE